MTIANDSGVEPQPGNRIYTFSGGDIILDGSSVTMLVYDSALSRWIVVGSNPDDVALSYAELYTFENVGVQNIDVALTYEICTNINTAGGASILTADAANSQIDIVGAGYYQITAHGSISGEADVIYNLAVFTNNVIANNMVISTYVQAADEVESFGIIGLMNLPTAISIDLRATADEANATFTIRHANITVQKIE